MRRLEQLITELCPDGVEFDTLGVVCEILDNQRKPITKKDRKAGIYAYYGANGIQDYVDDYIFDGTFLLMGEDGSVINKDNSPVLTWTTGKIWVNNHAHVLGETPKALLRFVYHYLQTIDVSPIVRGTPPKINQQILRNITIPLPPLPVQREIVRILDNFTELTTELTTELHARKQQYEYYRDSLLTFGDEVERYKLSEILSITRGVRVVKSQLSESGKYPVYQNSMTPLGYFEESNYATNTVFIISAGAAGSVGYSPVDFWAADDCYCLNCSEQLLSRYLYYALLYQQTYILSRVRRASIPRLGRNVIEKIKIPVPPLTEQQHIVDILDRFDKLCNDISEGLPAEIEARQKQYEYYRDKLLTFKECEK